MDAASASPLASKTELRQRFGKCAQTARISILCSPDGVILRQNAAAIGPLTGATISFSASPPLWAMFMPCRTGRVRSARHSLAPVQLTAGPLQFYSVTPSADGGKLFVQVTQRRAQLVRYDAKSKQFVPFLPGISATDLAYSPDGQWIAYVTIPEGSLWRSRVDGSERLQLTYPPTRAFIPVWSPDGTRILYQSFVVGRNWKAQSVPFAGRPVGGCHSRRSWWRGFQLDARRQPDDFFERHQTIHQSASSVWILKHTSVPNFQDRKVCSARAFLPMVLISPRCLRIPARSSCTISAHRNGRIGSSSPATSRIRHGRRIAAIFTLTIS